MAPKGAVCFVFVVPVTQHADRSGGYRLSGGLLLSVRHLYTPATAGTLSPASPGTLTAWLLEPTSHTPTRQSNSPARLHASASLQGHRRAVDSFYGHGCGDLGATLPRCCWFWQQAQTYTNHWGARRSCQSSSPQCSPWTLRVMQWLFRLKNWAAISWVGK